MTSPATRPYRGRFAPSPTGPLHAGSLVAALASWLDARAHGGCWLVRMEDVDTPRCVRGADRQILAQLAAVGLQPDEQPVYQSQRGGHYQTALNQLVDCGWAYPCACTRKQIAMALRASGQPHGRHDERVYPGTCRQGLKGQAARAWRLHTEKQDQYRPLAPTNTGFSAMNLVAYTPQPGPPNAVPLLWHDRLLGHQSQEVNRAVGDFVLKRADGLWSYQLAVVVDDAAQGISHVVRGQDLADNTPRQILLQQALGLPRPSYLHTPLVLAADGEKLSKQNGAQPLDTADPMLVLAQAGRVLGIQCAAANRADWLRQAVDGWADRHLKIEA